MPSLRSRVVKFITRRVTMFGGSEESVQSRRRRLDSMAKWMPTPRWARVTPVSAGGVPAEWIFPQGAPTDRVLLYIHGGAFAICSLNTHRPLVANLARAANCCALSLDYRLAPEHPFPAALEDCLAAYHWLLQQGTAPERIVVAGDSAGGNLALVLLLALREAGDPLPAGAACLSPVTELTGRLESRRTRASADPVLTQHTTDLVTGYIGSEDPAQPLLSPLNADLQGLPPILLHVGTEEILLDDSTLLVEKACAAGVDAQVVVWPGMWHVFQAMAPFLPEAGQSIQQIGQFINEIIRK